MRGAGIPPGADARGMNGGGRVYLRAPAGGDQEEFLELMRASAGFHQPWASAPTDPDRFAAYIADSARPDFEAMLLCRRADHAILGFFNLSQIVRRSLQSAAVCSLGLFSHCSFTPRDLPSLVVSFKFQVSSFECRSFLKLETRDSKLALMLPGKARWRQVPLPAAFPPGASPAARAAPSLFPGASVPHPRAR